MCVKQNIHAKIYNRIAQMSIRIVLQIILVLVLIQKASTQESSVALPGCQEKCGDVTIRHPFGIGRNCSIGPSFEIYCSNTFNQPPKPFLLSDNVEVLNISLKEGTISVLNPVFKDCTNENKTQDVFLDIHMTSFTFSGSENLFIALGCNNLALVKAQNGITEFGNVGGCMSFCHSNTTPNNDCFGINCCQTIIPPHFWNFSTHLRTIDPIPGEDLCRYALIVDKNWFGNLTNIYSVQNMKQVPAVLDWYFGLTEDLYNCTKSSVCGRNTYCINQTCFCREGYDGNPYLLQGCQDINECLLHRHSCQQICVNTLGNYSCLCKNGWEAIGIYNCTKKPGNVEVIGNVKKPGNVKKALIVTAIAICAGLGVVLVLAATWWLCKVTKRRKKRKLKKNNFERNGGLLLCQQVSSTQGNVDTTKLFTSKELEMATDHYNKDRILGQGGQGTVYKGMLTDGRIVAVKKSKIEDESKKEQFINEVVLLSKINHRNIVKLHGCCLETDVPLLVYEFIPNGTLFEYIHGHNEDFPLTWDVRVRVATEIAGALFYLHSAASIPIFHRDIKSSNILLDEKYRAKMADFGTSKSIAIDQTHMTTRVQGTFGYLDPEYFQSSQFTDKSDVYSFGIVLVELLTGQKPILTPRAHDQGRSLATHFILTMKENRLFDILDPLIAKEGQKEEITTFANIAYRCLNLNGRKRPTMKYVAAELESINMSGTLPKEEQHSEELEYPVADHLNGLWDLTSNSMSSSTSKSVKGDAEPLIRKY